MVSERFNQIPRLLAFLVLVTGVFWIVFYIAVSILQNNPIIPESITPKQAWNAFVDVTTFASFLAAISAIAGFRISQNRAWSRRDATIIGIIAGISTLTSLFIIYEIFQFTVRIILSVLLNFIKMIIFVLASLLATTFWTIVGYLICIFLYFY